LSRELLKKYLYFVQKNEIRWILGALDWKWLHVVSSTNMVSSLARGLTIHPCIS
jgi:hypothetical protein